jgi:hypothetical protein
MGASFSPITLASLRSDMSWSYIFAGSGSSEPPDHLANSDQHEPRIDGLLLALRHHAEKAAVAHHRDDARHGLERGLVEALEPGAIARRPHHAAMHHARQPHVLHEGGATRHLGRDVDARRGLADESCAVRPASAAPWRLPRA